MTTQGIWPLALDDMLVDVNEAEDKWGPFRSPHEAYGVLAEEVAELLDAIHANDIDKARAEALQVAAVAYRFARDGFERNPGEPT